MASFSSTARAKRNTRKRPGGWSSLGAVAAGGLVGSAGRAGIGLWILTPSEGFPTAVLMVNLAGSWLLGFYLARRERSVSRRNSLQFWAIGVFGSFTTFSAFSADFFLMLVEGRVLMAMSYLAASIGGGLSLALVGLRTGAAIR